MRGEVALPVRMVHIPNPVDVLAIREKTGLSQVEFALRFGFSARTLQEWEQGRTQPDGAVRAYLTVIGRNPAAVATARRSPTSRRTSDTATPGVSPR